MSGNLHAREMLEIAAMDLKSLRHMLDPAKHMDEVFGFHAQQAIEKSLKAWLSQLDVDYPHIHHLGSLLKQLAEMGEDVSSFWHLTDYTIFGVQYRYELLGDREEPLDRHTVLDAVEKLHWHVERLISE